MALQGDLHSFALADVLRLLAGTTKTGRLDVAGDAGNGEVWFDHGDLVGGEVTTSPHAAGSADVVFEMLRFENGTFRFDEGEVPPDTVERSDVDDAIAAAEALLVRWVAIEAVIPSVHSWVSLAEVVDADTITVSGDQWRLLAAIAAGSTPRLLGDRFELTDLEACTRWSSSWSSAWWRWASRSSPPRPTRWPSWIRPRCPPPKIVTTSSTSAPRTAPWCSRPATTRCCPSRSRARAPRSSVRSSRRHRRRSHLRVVEPEVFRPFGADEAMEVDEDDPIFTSEDEAATPSWSSYGSLDSMVDADPEVEPVDESVADTDEVDAAGHRGGRAAAGRDAGRVRGRLRRLRRGRRSRLAAEVPLERQALSGRSRLPQGDGIATPSGPRHQVPGPGRGGR